VNTLWHVLTQDASPKVRVGFLLVMVGAILLRFSGVWDWLALPEHRRRPHYQIQLQLTPHSSHPLPVPDPDRA